MAFDLLSVRRDFPILSRDVHGSNLIYLDNAASTQKPQAVIDAVSNAYASEYANVHRGLHFLSNLATDKYEAVREKVAAFLGAHAADEIVFVSNGTEAINTIAYGWAMPRIEAGDEIILSVMEHHANIIPWHFLRERYGAILRWIDVDDNGDLDPSAVISAIGPRTKIIALSHMSNVLGTIVDVAAICEYARSRGIVSVIDGCQAAAHFPVDVSGLNCDFYVVTGHKLYGPSGSGALYARSERLAEMQPFKGGGDMIRTVEKDLVTYNDPPMKFEAGTPNIVQVIGLGAALDYLTGIGMDEIARHETLLRDYAKDRLEAIDCLELYGRSSSKGAIFSFNLNGPAHPHDIATIVDRKGVALRAGHHCAQPLMKHLGVNATCRASFGLYNSIDDVDRLVDSLETCRELLG
ncbi:MAG: cysteine desulfurase [Pseudomonadota bacterium]